MTTLTVTIDTDSNASILKKMLRTLKFVKKIESEKDNYEFSAEQIQMLNERMEEYKKNPRNGKSIAKFKAEMKMKYGV